MPVSKGSKGKKIVRRLWAPPKWRDTLVISVIGGTSLIFIVSLAINWWQGSEIQRTFSEAAERGRNALAQVETLPETESKGARARGNVRIQRCSSDFRTVRPALAQKRFLSRGDSGEASSVLAEAWGIQAVPRDLASALRV